MAVLQLLCCVSEATLDPLVNDADVCVASPLRPPHRQLTVITADDAEVIQVEECGGEKMMHLFNPDFGFKHDLRLISCFSCLLVCETG